MGKEKLKTRWKMQRKRDGMDLKNGWDALNGNKQGDKEGG
jgi:hypothetical protein